MKNQYKLINKSLRLLLTFNFSLLTIFCFSQGAAINTTGAAADASAMLDVSSTSAGLLMPRMTTAERNAISNPAAGLLIVNTATNCIEVYFSPAWQTVFCGCTMPSDPVEGTHSTSATEITWNWNTVSGATGYKYNTINDYASANDNGANTSYIQTGLTCNTSYTLYIWSYNICGNSSSTSLTQSTSSCPFICGTNTVNFTYNGSSVTYGTVSGQNSTCWLDRNLGASQVATARNDAAGYGDLFQWGRLDDGHQLRSNNATTTTLSSSDDPGHSNFIWASGSPYDWRSPQNNSLWQGATGANNPCPSGWRLPTETEFDDERASWADQNYNGAIVSPLKLSAAGVHYWGSPGSITNEGITGYYWCSTIFGTDVRTFVFNSGGAFMNTYYRAYGRSVRCIKD